MVNPAGPAKLTRQIACGRLRGSRDDRFFTRGREQHGEQRSPPRAQSTGFPPCHRLDGRPSRGRGIRASEDPSPGRHLHLRQDDGGSQPRAESRAGPLPASHRSALLQPARRMERRRQAGPLPRPIVDHERRRQDVDLQAAAGREIPQRPGVRRRRREVQLRARPRPEARVRWARLSLRHRDHRSRRQAHRADRHQAAERLALGRHGRELVVHRAARSERPAPHRRGHRSLHPAGMDTAEPSQSAEESRLLGQGQALRGRGGDQDHSRRGQYHRPAPHGEYPPRAPRGQQELPPRKGRQAADRSSIAAARLRHGEYQPWAEALHGRAGPPGPRFGRRSHRDPPGGRGRPRIGHRPPDARHEAVGPSRRDVQGVVYAQPRIGPRSSSPRPASRADSRPRSK